MVDGVVGVVKVKPLVWDVIGWQSGDGIKGENDDTWSASAHGFQYCAYCIDWHGGADFRLTDPDDNRTSHSSLAAAKAAAQADYDARIMAALDVQNITVPDELLALAEAADGEVALLLQALSVERALADAFAAGLRVGDHGGVIVRPWLLKSPIAAHAALRAIAEGRE